MKKTNKLLSILSAAWMIILLVVFSYSWVARNWTPSLSQEQISIASTGALLIGLSNDTTYNSVSLNQVVGVDSFTFKQVSSVDGKTFHTVNFVPALQNKPPLFTGEDVKGRYIDVNFYLKSQVSNDNALNKSKYVFIHPDTKIIDTQTGQNISKAIRMAITIDGVNSNEPYILGRTNDDKDNIDYSTWAALPDAQGKPLYVKFPDDQTYNPDAADQQKVYNLNYFHGGRTTYDGDGNHQNDYNFTVDPTRTLLTIAPGEIRQVNLKIWLEGGDANCIDGIAGKSFSIMLKFDSVEKN